MLDSVFPSGEKIDQWPTGVVESRLDGAFQGYTGRTRFKLLNGQVWEQRSFNCIYRYAYMPRVAVFPSGDGFQMKIDGVPGTIPVRRLG